MARLHEVEEQVCLKDEKMKEIEAAIFWFYSEIDIEVCVASCGRYAIAYIDININYVQLKYSPWKCTLYLSMLEVIF